MIALAFALLLQADVPVEAAPPAGFDLSKPFRLLRDGAEVPVQRAGDKVVFLAPADDKASWKLESAAPKDFPKVDCADDGRRLLFTFGGKKVTQYNHAVVKAPEGVDDVFSRSGYLHPVWNPAGKVLSNDFPAKHLHHHGIWFPWTSSEFEGRKSDFWNSKDKQGRIECVKVEETCSGPVFAGFRAKHRFINLNAPDGPKTALDEVWEVRIYATDRRFLFDLVSTQTCATNAPLVIRKNRYGGLGFRGSGEWEGKDGVAFLTSGGHTRKDGHEKTADWCVMTSKVEGLETSIGFLGHPSNFRHPQPMRIHPDEPFFNWAPCQTDDFSIEPGKPYVSRYRFVVADGALGKDEMDRRFAEFSKPPGLLGK